MRIAILGTGMVGQAIAAKLVALGHTVVLGTRDVAQLVARTAHDSYGNPPFAAWHAQHPEVGLATFAEASAQGEIVFNATAGTGSLAALEQAGADHLAGKVLIDIANPLDFSRGMPPSLFVSNTDSLGEQIQRALPRTRVVKAINTMNADLMVNPGHLADGDHTVFICGNDADAKTTVTAILTEWFGWKDVVDLGDISGARGTEMLLPIWVRLFGTLQTPMIAFKLVR